MGMSGHCWHTNSGLRISPLPVEKPVTASNQRRAPNPRSPFGNRHNQRSFVRRNLTRKEREEIRTAKVRGWWAMFPPKYPAVHRQSHAAARKSKKA